ncbi:putative RNA methyltransferase [Arthrobacter oryzae]|uniref:23S rRNA (Guanine745-N1)-methyltransferase n=1 Tax=Arthrobacter oryzae TaxID=409290 RepID=A0A495FNZ8_9MICC|nr:methyltransferase domain-containing protein [Arthrobacter oryzae]RKR30269.1 23S rRNA (guanine745-N1)-methyltransferase [Arthrobacter oryzae]
MPPAADFPLLCPVCRDRLRSGDDATRTLVCGAGHSFDAAKQGYFNFLVGKGTVFEADTADMVAARFDFLSAGHYQPLASAVAELAAPALARSAGKRPTVLDAGTGTGHYLRAVLDRAKQDRAKQDRAKQDPTAQERAEQQRPEQQGGAPDGFPREIGPAQAIGLDISKFALRRAARMNPEAFNVVGDVWQPLPVADHAADVVTVVFAPRNAPEFARVLRPGGRLVVVTPRPGHLEEIAGQAGLLGIEPAKDERLAVSLGKHFTPAGSRDLDLALSLDPRDVANLALMGPAGHHLDRAALAALEASLPARTSVSARFRISVFEPIPRAVRQNPT